MSLTLNAEQKNISKIFEDKTKYIIPAYQRPYSWVINECKELFEDLKREGTSIKDTIRLVEKEGYKYEL